MMGAAQGAGQGGSISGAINVAPGVFVFRITEAGLAADLGITGAKCFKGNKLNFSNKFDISSITAICFLE
jgi:hypothetical protein